MEKIGLFWGSNTGNQEEATNFLTDYMKSEGYEIELYNIAETPPAKMLEYKKLIIGCPTWHIGELQDDWDTIYEEYKKLDFSNITAAFFGCGDQVGYSDNFLDALGLIAKPFTENGGKLNNGETCLIWGASGGLGVFAIQLVKYLGGIPICVVSTKEKAEYCKLPLLL